MKMLPAHQSDMHGFEVGNPVVLRLMCAAVVTNRSTQPTQQTTSFFFSPVNSERKIAPSGVSNCCS